MHSDIKNPLLNAYFWILSFNRWL